MTEPLIRESAPTSSVILAYGMAPQRSSWKIAVLVGSILVLVGLISVFLWTLFSASIPIPTSTSVLIKLPASERLTDDAPAVWHEAQQHSKPFFVLVGRATGSDGTPRAFAIVPRVFGWQVLSEDLALETTTTRLTSLSRNPLARAWMRIWPSKLSDESVFTTDSVGGSLDATSWNTELPAPIGTALRQRLSGKNFLNLLALPNAWPYAIAVLNAAGYDLRETESPASIEWTHRETGEISVALHFDEPLSLTSRAHFASAAGLYDQTKTLLGDGSIVESLDLPIKLLESSSSTDWTSDDGRHVSFVGNSIYFGDMSIVTSTKDIPKACQNHIIAAFDRSGLGSFFASLGLLSTANIQTIYWTEKNGKISICWG